jgi:hypothetical protein
MTNKKFLIGMPVLLIAALFFLGCPTDSENDPTEPSNVTGTALALDSHVVTPVLGAAAKTAVDADQYSGPIDWTPAIPEDGKFVAKTVYTAKVALKAASGFTFDGVGDFTHGGATSVTQTAAGDVVTVTIVFPPTAGDPLNPGPVDALDLSGAIATPVAGAAASGVFTSPDGTQYTGGAVAWTPDPVDGNFAGGESYTASVTLTARPGYTFDGAGDFTYGALNVTTAANDDGTVTVRVAFGPTQLAVTYLDLSSAIAAPVTGGAPVYFFTSPSTVQYDGGNVTWDPPILVNANAFEADTVYTATVTLTAKTGYTFAGLSGADFSYAGATGIDFDAATGVLAVTFRTAAVVSELNLSAALGAPVKGQTAATAVNGTQYDGPVAWIGTLVGTQFGAATGYTAVATLSPLPGFTFTGFTGAFSYPGASLVEQEADEKAGTVKVTVRFEDTAASEEFATIEFEPVKVTSDTGSLEGIALVKGGAPVKLTVSTSSGYSLSSVKWYLDGNSRALSGAKDGLSGNTLTLDPAKHSVREKAHHVTVTAKVDGKSYSVTVPFTVAAGN